MQMGCLAIEEFDEFGDNLLRRFFHEPMAGIANDHPFAALVRICERVIFFEMALGESVIHTWRLGQQDGPSKLRMNKPPHSKARRCRLCFAERM